MTDKTINIRNVTHEDIDELVKLDALCFDSDRWHPRDYGMRMRNRKAHLWTVEQDGQLVAQLIVQEAHYEQENPQDRLYIDNIAVHPSSRGQGLAILLLERARQLAVQKGLTAISLHVKCNNAAAIALYKKVGFAIQKHKPCFYLNGDDAWVMTLTIDALPATGPKLR